MADGRRRRWVAHDVHFLDEPLGEAVFDRFGAAGVALWFGFIAACKRYHIEGSCSWASDVEALGLFGLPGMALVDNDGEPFGLHDWLGVLSDHKVIRRTVRGRRVKVVCTKWEPWQQVRNRSRTEPEESEDSTDGGQRIRRSGGGNTDTKPPHNYRDSAPDLDLDSDQDKFPSGRTDPAWRQAVGAARQKLNGKASFDLLAVYRTAARDLLDSDAQPQALIPLVVDYVEQLLGQKVDSKHRALIAKTVRRNGLIALAGWDKALGATDTDTPRDRMAYAQGVVNRMLAEMGDDDG